MSNRRSAVNWSAMMKSVATRLLGPPAFMERGGVYRWGFKGHIRVDCRKGRWQDYLTGQSGGVLDFVETQKNLSRSDAVKWLRDEGFFAEPGVVSHRG